MEGGILQEAAFPDRRGTNSTKWDGMETSFGQNDLLPLWVADMDFKAPRCVRDALHRAVDQGVFGYYTVPGRYWDAIITWEKTRYGRSLQREWLRNTAGVVSGLFHLLSAITQPGDGVLVLTPVYYPFFRAIKGTGRELIASPLREEGGYYTPDLEDLEQKLAVENVKVFLLCSPHNPVGRVWTEGELRAMLDCCRRHGVQVVSDEIHHDLMMPGQTHLPAAELWEGENPPITFFSASKTFNLAGMKNSLLVLPQKETRAKFDAFEAALGAPVSSTLDYVAVTAAYSEGGAAWLDAILGEIYGNYLCLKEALSPFPGVTVSPLEGTYLLWIDLGGMVPPKALHHFMQNLCGIAPDYGHWFYPAGEDSHIRLNLAAPRATISLAAGRLADGLRKVRPDHSI